MADPLRLRAIDLDVQAKKLLKMKGDAVWERIGCEGRNKYRYMVIEILQGCGIKEVVLTDGGQD